MSGKPEQFGNYLLLERLAAGGMAEVFLARAPSAAGIAKFVAIKRILPQFSDNPEFIEMFKDEAKIAVNLSHSNIVSINGFDIVENRFFIVMDYVEGKNLRQILNKLKQKKSRFSVEQIVFMIKEVTAGLDNAHRCLDGSTGKPLNLTHRDMSPQNIMISFEGEVKIVDFGIAKAETQLETTRAGTLKGKFGYMSPEQADGLPVDLRTDIFSIGIVLWELLANDRLFVANNEMNTLRKIRQCEIPSLLKIDPNIPIELERIAMKALSKDRNSRYQTASAIHRDLNRFLNRHFPDFSSQEFSMFIKTMYTEEILENRKKLTNYAQLQNESSRPAPTSDNDDETMVTEPTATNGDFRFDKIQSRAGSDDEFNFKTQPKHVLDDDALNKTFGTLDKDGKPMGLLTNPSIKSPKVASKNPKLASVGLPALDVEAGNPRPAQRPIANPQPRKPLQQVAQRTTSASHYDDLEPRPSSWMGYIFLFFALAGSLYYFKMTYPEQFAHVKSIFTLAYNSVSGNQVAELSSRQQEDKSSINKVFEDVVTPSNKAKADEQKETTSSDPFIVVRSQPSGAEIFVNGESKKTITPARIEVPTIPFTMELRKSAYTPVVRKNLSIDKITGKTLDITLQRAVEGLLDLDVKPAGNARVFINGIPLNDIRLPLNRHRIPANQTVTVKAINPISGRSVERNVKVRPDERISLILDLKNPEKSFTRTPANR